MFNYLKSKLKQCIDPLKVVDSKNVRKSLRYYFKENNYICLEIITKVECFENSKGLIILIETHRPGLLIGKGGEDIDHLTNYLKRDLNHNDITIDVRESKLWSNLY